MKLDVQYYRFGCSFENLITSNASGAALILEIVVGREGFT